MSQAFFDVVIVGGTPGGIMAGIAAAREGKSAIVLERTGHVGGLPANGLGATDIGTRGCTGGLFGEFVGRVKRHYEETCGAESEQVRDCSDGYHFEPHVGEKVLLGMLAEWPGVVVRTMQQFDALREKVRMVKGRGVRERIGEIAVIDRGSGRTSWVSGKVFLDATYEGDLAAAAGCAWRTRREGRMEYGEAMAGKVYKAWGTSAEELGKGSTGEGDETIQAYNYRLCLTDVAGNRASVARPAKYDRQEYVSLIEDVKLQRWAGKGGYEGGKELHREGIGRLVNMVRLPNGKTDSNNQHLAFISTDLPVENYEWPTAGWEWRDEFAGRLRDYILGLLWFAQHDEGLPGEFREKCLEWGLAADEYGDNGNFPRQVYVREGRRVEGLHLFTAWDALPGEAGGRPPVHPDSITASHYALDSHAHQKREEGRVHLDGFLSCPTVPYTVPYGVIVPRNGPENLLTPVPVSGTHIGFSTLRMEPCWMALGEAAGVAASLMVETGVGAARVDVGVMQEKLLDAGAVLMYFADARPGEADFKRIQKAGLRREIRGWKAL